MEKFREMRKLFFLFMLLASPAMAQVAVAPSPVARQQFFGVNGAPLASGCIFTYISTTSTPQATYTDYTGTALNPNPIILDAGGFANIWLSNVTYRFVLVSAGGVNCATGITQFTIDGISAYTIINTPQNLFVLGATSDPSGTAGELAYRSDIPCFRVFTTFWDCLVTLTATQTLTNKTLTAPTITSPTITGTIAGSPTITTPVVTGGTFTAPVIAAGTPTGAGALGYGSGNLNVGSGAANNTIPYQTGAIVPGHLVGWNTGGVVQDAGFAIVPPANLLITNTAPTISSGFGVGASIVGANGSASFSINVGSGGVASSGVISLPTATTGWNCFASDITNPTTGGGALTKQTATTINTATITGFNPSIVQTAWTASDILLVSCFAR